jgi:hypothetical protein
MRPALLRTALLAPCALALLLAGCGGGGVEKKQINPPRASLQQLTVLPNGQWRLVVRLQNFSNRPTKFVKLDAALSFAGQDAGSIGAAPDIDIGPSSADTVETTITPSLGAKTAVASALSASQSVRYHLKGQILTTQRNDAYDFEYESSLNPAPGLPGVMR